MIKIQYFDMYYPILGIKRISIGFNWLSYTINKNPVTNKTISKGLYIKYITKLINNINNE